MNPYRFSLTMVMILVSPLPAYSAEEDSERKRRTTHLTEEEAGRDFVVQGEYVGTLTIDEQPVDVGVQVIALGDGKFRAVAYPGGLPGAGWTGGDSIVVDGSSEGKTTTFVGENATGVIAGGVLTVQSNEGVEQGQLERIVRESDTLAQEPPEDAVVLFDGSSADEFIDGEMTSDGLLKQGTTSRKTFTDFKLHMEFQLSFMPFARGQGRSNSGVYLQGRYECQILDSFGLDGHDNECGGVYGTKRPAVNMCLPPLSWQTYDIEFTAAKFDDTGKLQENARMSVWHNGVKIHDEIELPKATTAAPLGIGPEPGPIYIQDHGNELRFRNIWVVPR